MITQLNKVVLERINFTYSSTFGAEFFDRMTQHIDAVYSTPKALWAKSIGANVTHCRTTKELEAEIVIYTELTDVQTTEFVLRFA